MKKHAAGVIEEAIRRYEAGDSTAEIGAALGVGRDSIYRWARQVGVTKKPHLGVRRGRHVVAAESEAIAAAYSSGETLEAVAELYGLAVSTAANVVRAHGGEIRHRGTYPRAYGAANPAFKTGRFVKDGYWVVLLLPDHPLVGMADTKRYVLEHRLVMAQTIRRPLLPSETVHHINGDRGDNRPENLQLRSGKHGTGVHLRCHDCGSQNVGPVEL